MPAANKKLTDQEIWDVVAYIRSLANPPYKPASNLSVRSAHGAASACSWSGAFFCLVWISTANNRAGRFVNPRLYHSESCDLDPIFSHLRENNLSLCNVNIKKDWWHVACAFRLRNRWA